MSLNTVVEDIREEARQTAEELLESADVTANAIIAEAESEAEAIVARQEREVERQIEQEREQRLSSAKLDVKQQRLAAKRDILEQVRSTVETRLTKLEGDRRRDLTTALLKDALTEFESDAPIRVYGRASDEELIVSIIDDLEGDVVFGGSTECLGGVIVASDASRIRVDNTFDSVLEEVWSDNLKEVSEQLFAKR